MSLYPLGISRSRDVPSVPGQDAGAVSLRWSLAGELACAFIDAPHQAVPPMLHATALEAIHRRICVLPIRFGVALRNEAEVSALLQERRHELLDQLRRLDWTCEMGLRITPPSPPEPQGAASSAWQSPLDYLERRRAGYRRADEKTERERSVVQQFVVWLHGYYRQWRMLSSSPLHLIRLAFLVERDRVTAFRSRAEQSRKAREEDRCVILGPWPPYSFV